MDKFVSNHLTINEVHAPASKSFAQRYILAAALSSESTTLKNIGECDDVLNIKTVAKQFGADIIDAENSIMINGKQNPIQTLLNCGESGLGIRLTTIIASTFGQNFTITGEGSLLNRPHQQLGDILTQMGVNIEFTENSLPLNLCGQLVGGQYKIDGSLSSQFISGLLMALPLCQQNSILEVAQPKSTPYIDVTISVLKDFGIKIEHQAYETYQIEGNQKYVPTKKEFSIEGDWSGAAFWVVYGLINGQITIKNLNPKSTQADKAILNVVELVGSNFEWHNADLYIEKKDLNPFEFDATHCPDLFPILVVLAASINGVSKIHGANRLIHKESNRGIVLQKEFKKLGLVIDINDDIMVIYGTGKLKSGSIDSNNDHRIAMCAAIAALIPPKGIHITGAESVNKSYPEFWQHLT